MRGIYFFVIFGLFIQGCAPVLIGAGAAAGYTLSNDAVIGNLKSEYRDLWDICMDTLKNMESEIEYANESKGLIKAKTSEYGVTVKINSIDVNTQKLKVTARKNLLPQPHFAQKIFLKIRDELE